MGIKREFGALEVVDNSGIGTVGEGFITEDLIYQAKKTDLIK